MQVVEITSKSLLRKGKRIESWFLCRYGMNLYRGCAHNCVYCDGRAEKYNVEGEFGEQVAVKLNAPQLLTRELDPARKRSPMKRAYVMLGGGVGDSYQSPEKDYGLTRQALQIIEKSGLPVHILTKSTLVERDLEIISRIHKSAGAIVSFSFSSVDAEISRIVEPGVPSPAERLRVIRLFRAQGIPCGIYYMPVIPYITDATQQLQDTVQAAKAAWVDFMIFGGLTLKEGRQKDYFLQMIKERYPHLEKALAQLYTGDPWGNANPRYIRELDRRFIDIAQVHNMPARIPLRLYKDIIDDNDRVVVMLEHIDYYLRARGNSSAFGYAAYNLAQVKEPLSALGERLGAIKGVSPHIVKIIREILATGTCELLSKFSTGQG
ncbi:MAG TPA: radical SAM protein [bacterium]|nr:radical SAM protein [bacterium]HPN42788.1 radical SAM protein [bacterium]